VFAASAGESGAILSAASLPLDVGPGRLAALRIEEAPGPALAGGLLATQPTVSARDAAGNVLTAFDRRVVVSVEGGTAQLSGALAVSAAAGVARFTDLVIDAVGDHALRFATQEACGVSVLAPPLAVSGPVAAMAFTQFPNVAEAVGGLPFETMPHVTLYDAAGRVALAAPTLVSVAIAVGPGTLAGTRTVLAQSGVARFTDLAVDERSTDYIVTFSALAGLLALNNTLTVPAALTLLS